ncbi:hypothetical protein LXL04_007548 [Taraxacum kok-saghyz]
MNDLLTHNPIEGQTLFNHWCWGLENSKIYSVRSLRVVLDENMLDEATRATIWAIQVPIKVNVFVWRLRPNRLPTRVNLEKRGMVLQDYKCVCCNVEEETVQHLLVDCGMAKELLAVTGFWAASLNFPLIINSTEDLFSQQPHPPRSKEKEASEVIARALLWTLWRFRNGLLFEGKVKTTQQLLMEVKEVAYNWIKSRSKWYRNCLWSDWFDNPAM